MYYGKYKPQDVFFYFLQRKCLRLPKSMLRICVFANLKVLKHRLSPEAVSPCTAIHEKQFSEAKREWSLRVKSIDKATVVCIVFGVTYCQLHRSSVRCSGYSTHSAFIKFSDHCRVTTWNRRLWLSQSAPTRKLHILLSVPHKLGRLESATLRC